ncbi:hypothetical protein NW752_000053 [Fusarium irregulare]|uniref:Peptidase S8/S53 domain-containing protein n=1 Tax=Fusarium irregulare TaxID=2494466 RepID=A0A9W8Q0M7_9HYPO|nr:hypothetical protein NW766_001786 [Fusarium irregulare]KAJ4027808.1 hypothetical protein NW752_000053 [Fusarium irregulare]
MSTVSPIRDHQHSELNDVFSSVEADTESKSGNETSDGSGSEDEGGEDGGKMSVEGMVTQVLKDIGNGELDLTNSKTFAAFINQRGRDLTRHSNGNDRPAALHMIMKRQGDKPPKFDEKLEPLIKFLCRQESYLEIVDSSSRTALFVAVEEKIQVMVEWMCDSHPDIGKIIPIPGSKGMNCLHIGISKRIKFLDKLLSHSKSEAIAAKDNNGNTPLHLAVNYKNCKRQQVKYVRTMLEKGEGITSTMVASDFNNCNLSPYLYHKQSAREGRQKANKKTDKSQKDTEFDPTKGNTISTPQIVSSGPLARPEPREIVQVDPRTKYGGGNPIQTSIRRGSLAPSAASVAPTESKVAAPSGSSNTKKSKKSSGKSDPVDENIVMEVERLLKLHYLRTRDCATAMEILYGKNTPSEKELNFDLHGILAPGEVLTQAGLRNLTGKIDFEDILQYVCIPQITVENPPSRSKVAVRRPDGAGRWDLEHIFKRLRDKEVKTILRVIIDDSKYPSHSDEAIERALSGFGVEIWMWNKPDLCTEVILKAAPAVREVHLYWSGNNAVLRGWSEAGGLPTLKALKVVKLHTQQGLERKATMERNVREFEERMKLLCKSVKVVRADGLDDHGRRNDRIPPHEWIQCMTDFRILLFDAERSFKDPNVNQSIEHNVEQIKVAIIDDGVDMKDLNYHFIGGKSFSVRSEDQGLVDPYYMSRTGHGTIMAKQIEFMCPQARFFVLKVEVGQSEDETKLNFTARSAAKAIRAAIVKGVHIISMSWTVEPPEDDKERQELESAIIDAAKANILMFCSARDKGANSDETYPSKATNNIFTIGAANASGACMDYVGNTAKLNYTFPGDKVEVNDGPNKTTSKTVDGSSVATALASGLAALILYCVQVRIFLAKDSDKQKAREDYKKVKQFDGMKKALRVIDTTEESHRKFLKVWELFGNVVEQKQKPTTKPEEYLDLVAEVGRRLCSKIY